MGDSRYNNGCLIISLTAASRWSFGLFSPPLYKNDLHEHGEYDEIGTQRCTQENKGHEYSKNAYSFPLKRENVLQESSPTSGFKDRDITPLPLNGDKYDRTAE